MRSRRLSDLRIDCALRCEAVADGGLGLTDGLAASARMLSSNAINIGTNRIALSLTRFTRRQRRGIDLRQSDLRDIQ